MGLPRKNHSIEVAGSKEHGSRTVLSSVATVSLMNPTSLLVRLDTNPNGRLNFECPAPFFAVQV